MENTKLFSIKEKLVSDGVWYLHGLPPDG